MMTRRCQKQPDHPTILHALLEHGLRQLLDKQRDALGPRQDVLENGWRQPMATGNLADEALGLGVAQTVQREQCDMWEAGPLDLKLGPAGDDEQHAQPLDSVDDEVEQLPRGRVEPVRVLKDEEYRLLLCKALQVVRHRAQRARLLLLRGERRE